MKQRKPAGCPLGSTNEKKRQQVKLEDEARHGIVCHYVWETQNSDKS